MTVTISYHPILLTGRKTGSPTAFVPFDCPTLEALKKVICEYAWCQATFKDGYRNVTNAQHPDHGTSLVVLDVDDGTTVDEAINAFKDYKHIIAASANHRIDKHDGKGIVDRMRIILFLESKVVSNLTYKAYWETCASMLPKVDPAAKDIARFWYPCRDILSSSDTGLLIQMKKPGRKDKAPASTPASAASGGNNPKGWYKDYIENGIQPGQGRDSKYFRIACALRNDFVAKEKALELLSKNAVFDETFTLANLEHHIHCAYSYDIQTSISKLLEHYFADSSLLPIPFMWQSRPEGVFYYRYTKPMPCKEVTPYGVKTAGDCRERMYRDINSSLPHEKLYATKVALEKLLLEVNKIYERQAQETNKPLSLPDLRDFFYDHVFTRWNTSARFRIPEEVEIRSISIDPTKTTFNFVDATTLCDGPTPAWDDFLNRLESPEHAEVFLAWLWSIFEHKNKSVQALWISGEGADGKSTIINALIKWLGGDSRVASLGAHSNGEFTNADVYGKRLYVAPDTKDANLLKSQRLHQITSGDLTTINAKFQPAFSAKLYAKVLISANFQPNVSTEINEARRLIYLRVSAPDRTRLKKEKIGASWENNLIAERDHLLYRARIAYDKLCTDHVDIELLPLVQDSNDTIRGTVQEQLYDIFFDECLEEDPNSSIPDYILKRMLKQYFEDNGEKHISPLVVTGFERKLGNWGFNKSSVPGSKVAKHWIGIKVSTHTTNLTIERFQQIEKKVAEKMV